MATWLDTNNAADRFHHQARQGSRENLQAFGWRRAATLGDAGWRKTLADGLSLRRRTKGAGDRCLSYDRVETSAPGARECTTLIGEGSRPFAGQAQGEGRASREERPLVQRHRGGTRGKEAARWKGVDHAKKIRMALELCAPSHRHPANKRNIGAGRSACSPRGRGARRP